MEVEKMKCQNITISRSYIISQKELKKKLKIKGNIQSISLWSGLNEHQEEQGESHNKDEWEIVTHEYDTPTDVGEKTTGGA